MQYSIRFVDCSYYYLFFFVLYYVAVASQKTNIDIGNNTNIVVVAVYCQSFHWWLFLVQKFLYGKATTSHSVKLSRFYHSKNRFSLRMFIRFMPANPATTIADNIPSLHRTLIIDSVSFCLYIFRISTVGL